MEKYLATADISQAAEHVWEALVAVERWPEWLPTVTSIEPLDGLPLQSGRRFRISQPKLRAMIWTVSDLDQPLRFEWRAKAVGLELVADHVLEPIASALTRVHLTLYAKGGLSTFFAVLFGATAREYLRLEAQALKKRVDSLRADRP